MYFPVLLWSLVIFASFWGYGEALRRAVKRPEFEDLGWGLTAAWGMAVTLAIGGFLMMLSLAKAPMLTGVVLVGAAFALYFFAQRLTSATAPQPASKKSKSKKGKTTEERTSPPTQATSAGYPTVIANILIWGLAALAFASSIAWPFQVDPNDDLTGYLVYPYQILQTGTLIEPFSFQRAGTFGGQALLQALVFIAGGERNAHLPDRGFAMVVLVGILLQSNRSKQNWIALFAMLPAFALLFIPVPRISTHGAMMGGCFLVAMVATMQKISLDQRDWRGAIPPGILAAAACTIRPTFTLLLALFYVVYLVITIFQHHLSLKEKWQFFSFLIKIGLVALLVIAPFSILLFISNGTPIIPPFQGFVDTSYQIHSYQDWAKDRNGMLTFLESPAVISLYLLGVFGVLVAASRLQASFITASILASLFVLYKFSAQSYVDKFRFVYPLIAPALFYTMVCTINNIKSANFEDKKLKIKALILLTLISAGFIFLFITHWRGAASDISAQFLTIPEQAKETRPFLNPEVQKFYAQVQNLVPRGEKIATVVDGSYLMNFERNPIYSLNVIGACSPPPGIPYGKEPVEVAQYFKNLGINYLICVDFDNAVLLYTRRLWTEHTRPEIFYQKVWKPRFLDFMNAIDELDKMGYVTARAGNIRLFDFAKPL